MSPQSVPFNSIAYGYLLLQIYRILLLIPLYNSTGLSIL